MTDAEVHAGMQLVDANRMIHSGPQAATRLAGIVYPPVHRVVVHGLLCKSTENMYTLVARNRSTLARFTPETAVVTRIPTDIDRSTTAIAQPNSPGGDDDAEGGVGESRPGN